MRNNITDPFERLIISLYTYIPPRRREDYYLMYYSNKPLDEMSKKIKLKIILQQIVSLYLTSIKLLQHIDNKNLNVQMKYNNRL